MNQKKNVVAKSAWCTDCRLYVCKSESQPVLMLIFSEMAKWSKKNSPLFLEVGQLNSVKCTEVRDNWSPLVSLFDVSNWEIWKTSNRVSLLSKQLLIWVKLLCIFFKVMRIWYFQFFFSDLVLFFKLNWSVLTDRLADWQKVFNFSNCFTILLKYCSIFKS